MAGHSQFKNIMYRKGKQDAMRSRLFSKLAREITVAAKTGVPDPSANPRLRAAVQAARAESMPKDNIERAIKKATGPEEENYEEVRYEGYAPGGVAFIIESLTNNRNRTAGEIRAAFTKAGGALAETGAVAFSFAHVGLIKFLIQIAPEDHMIEAALESGAEDVTLEEDVYEITTSLESLREVQKILEEKFQAEAVSAHFAWKSKTSVAVDSEEAGEKILKLAQALEDNEDVQNVYLNAQFSEAILEKMRKAP